MCVCTHLTSKFLILDIYHPDTICVSKNVRVRGYVSKGKGIREPKEKNGMRHSLLPRSFFYFFADQHTQYCEEYVNIYTYLCTDSTISTVATK